MPQAKQNLYELVYMVWKCETVSSMKITPPTDKKSPFMVTFYRSVPGPVGAERGEVCIGTFAFPDAVEYMKAVINDAVQ